MRGKKADPEFVSQFISNCVQQGIITPESIVQFARDEIAVIDAKIKEVETLKITRSKILDVVSTFYNPKSKVEEAKLLPFFTLKYPDICKSLCDQLTIQDDGRIDISTLDADSDYVFCIKQMLQLEIVCRSDYFIMQGDRFGEYMIFVLRSEVK